MAGEGMRCAPLCQHPGCWNSSLKAGHDDHKNSEYYNYLSELLSRRRAVSRPQLKDGTFTSDGLPTLKVHTVDQTCIDHAGGGEVCRRSRTLPPIQLCSNRAQSGTGNHKRSLSDKLIREKPPGVKFFQLNLQVDNNPNLSSSQLPLDNVTFSPVLIWKPSSKPSPSQPTSQTAKHNVSHTQSPVPPPASVQHPSSEAVDGETMLKTSVSCSNKMKEGKESGERKSPLLTMKTTDLTQALPSEVSEEKKVSSSHKLNKGKRRLPLGDTESFSYLGDIPPHVVAEILQQLRSESSSSINASHSLSLKQGNYSKTPDVPPQSTHHTAPPNNTNSNNNNNNTSVLPLSITYDLSTKKVTPRTKQKLETTQRRRVSSFSRELSKHPLEVLKRRSVFSGWIQHGIIEQKRNSTNKDISNEDTLTDVTTKASASLSPHKTKHVVTTTLEPPVAMFNRSRQVTGHRLSHVSRESHHSTHDNVVHGERGTCVENTSPLLSPRRIMMDLGVSFKDSTSLSSHQLHPPGGGGGDMSAGHYTRGKPHIVHLPRHHLSISASSHRSARAYSEDESSIASPEQHGVELVACGESFTRVPPPSHTRSNHPKPETIVENRTSVSPDYMLVGAHFTGDHLVLSDRGGNVVHHDLNDTESEPVLESNTAEPEQDIPRIESFGSKELLEKPTAGVRAPPSTAAEEEVRLSESGKFETVQDTITEETEECLNDHSESNH